MCNNSIYCNSDLMDKHCLIGIRRLGAHMATSYQLSLYSVSYSSCISEGYWEDDKLHGRGRVINFDGEYYIGDWEGGSRNGEGTHYDKDGNRYEGGWKHDSYYGQGTFYANNGDKYTGEWDGFIKGQGQINYKDGKKYLGQWDHYGGYKRHGLGALYSADGQVLNKGMWHWDEYEIME